MIRTETTHELLVEQEYYYYHFYNNGNSDSIRVYIVSENDVLIEAILAKNMYIRPPFEKGYLVKQSKMGSVEIVLTENDLKDKVDKD